jgi:hypothetical protein
VRHRVSPLSARGPSVKDDWRASLPEEKSEVFRSYVQRLEAGYTMLSVSLNEALELRQSGHLIKSCWAVGVTPALCSLLAEPLAALLRSLCEHARHYGTVPNAAPLDPANFHGAKEQRSARMSGLLSHVLLSQRAQFLHKINTLQEMVEDLDKEFGNAATDLVRGVSTDPTVLWESLDASHYDLNTCLREAIVLLKSFLHALPDDQLGAFQKTVLAQERVREPEVSVRARLIHHRRMAPIAGE